MHFIIGKDKQNNRKFSETWVDLLESISLSKEIVNSVCVLILQNIYVNKGCCLQKLAFQNWILAMIYFFQFI